MEGSRGEVLKGDAVSVEEASKRIKTFIVRAGGAGLLQDTDEDNEQLTSPLQGPRVRGPRSAQILWCRGMCCDASFDYSIM